MKIKKTLIFSLTVAFCYALTGLILLGPNLFNFKTTAKYQLIFAVTAIVLITALRYWSIREFILTGLLITMVAVFMWSRNEILSRIIRDILWFVIIGVFVFLSHRVLKLESFQKLRVLTLIVWIVSFNLIYLLMVIFNIYVFNFYRINADSTLIFYLKESLRFGSVTGLGIGLGYLLADFIIDRLESSNN